MDNKQQTQVYVLSLCVTSVIAQNT